MISILNDASIFERSIQEDKPLITPFDKALLSGHSYDMRLGGNFKLQGEEIHNYINLDIDEVETVVIQPLEFMLAHTEEYLCMPATLIGKVEGKSGLARLGLQVQTSNTVQSLFHGQITLELFNQSRWPIVLKKGIPICQISFVPVEYSLKDYSKVGSYHKQTGAQIPCNLF